MRIGRIEHVRCGETEGYTYIGIPDEITKEQFEEDVEKAAAEYIKSKDLFKKLNGKPSFPSHHINDFPDDMTIREAKELIKNKDLLMKNWKDAEYKATRNFSFYLKDYYISLSDLDDKNVLETEIDWGHRHGENIEYSISVLDKSMKE